MRGHPTDNPLIKDEPKTHFNRNSFIFVVGGTTGPGKALIEQMLHKVRFTKIPVNRKNQACDGRE